MREPSASPPAKPAAVAPAANIGSFARRAAVVTESPASLAFTVAFAAALETALPLADGLDLVLVAAISAPSNGLRKSRLSERG
jgi:hypothetical protein